MADLVPSPTKGGDYCAPGEPGGRVLFITVTNQGKTTSGTCTTSVTLPDGSTVDVPTPALGPQKSVELPSVGMLGCGPGNCGFTITVDSKHQVTESDKTNNTAKGGCNA